MHLAISTCQHPDMVALLLRLPLEFHMVHQGLIAHDLDLYLKDTDSIQERKRELFQNLGLGLHLKLHHLKINVHVLNQLL